MKKLLKNILVTFMKKKMGDGREYILFRIDVYFFEYILAV